MPELPRRSLARPDISSSGARARPTAHVREAARARSRPIRVGEMEAPVELDRTDARILQRGGGLLEPARARTPCAGDRARPRPARARRARPRTQTGARPVPPQSSRPSSRDQRARASSRLSTARGRWSMRDRRITRRRLSPPAAPPRPRGRRARRGSCRPSRSGARRARRTSTSDSTTVLERRPRPSISTSTTSPGSIGREFAGVPVSTTSPGSVSRHRSASW